MEQSKKTKVDTSRDRRRSQVDFGKFFSEDKEGTQAKRIVKKYLSDEGKGVINKNSSRKPRLGLGMIKEVMSGLKYKDLSKEEKNSLSNWGMNKEEFDQMSKEIRDLSNKSSERVTAGLKKGGAVKKKAKSPLFKVTNRGPLKKKKA